MRTPEWSHLQTFLLLARTRRLAAAGRRLHVDHSTVSRQVAALEDALSVRLFDRRDEGFFLTPEGERLFAAAEQMESLMLDAHSEIVGKDLEITGTVRLGAPDGLGVGYLASRLARFAAAQRGLTIELVAVPRVFNLTRREADIAISLTRPAKGRLVGRKLTDYKLKLYGARSYLASRSPIRKPADLLLHQMIGYIEDLTFLPELSYLHEIHPSLQPGFASSTMMVQMEAICAGAGIGVLPQFLAVRNKELVCVLPDQIELVRTFWLCVPVDLRRLARVRAISDFIADQIRQESSLFF